MLNIFKKSVAEIIAARDRNDEQLAIARVRLSVATGSGDREGVASAHETINQLKQHGRCINEFLGQPVENS